MNAARNEIEGELVTREQEPVRGTAMATTPSHLLAMAVQQNADLDKLERLMALQDRWEATEARKAFTVAMTGFKAEPVEILKAKHVEFTTRSGDVTSYNHAELSDITAAVGPALAKHKLSYRWDVRQESGAITVECILTHVMGHSERVTMTAQPDNSGMKNAIQQVASTTTYLQRYTLLAITGMSTKGMDDDGRGSELKPEDFITEEQEATIADLIAESATDKAKFLAYWKIESIAGLLKSEYDAAVKLLKQKIAANAKAGAE